MVKKTLIKTALREIRDSLGRYLAIWAIVGLGVGFFAGLRMCQPAMSATGIAYLEEQKLFDFRLLSTLGFTAEDAAHFGSLDGVEAARGAVYADFLAAADGGDERVIMAHSLTEDIDLPQLFAGRMPERANECLADIRLFTEEDIGKTLTVSSSNDEDTRKLLRCGGYTIVGLVRSPYYLNYERGTSSLGGGSVAAFIYIPEDGFDFEAYYEIFLTITDPAGAYSDAYTDQIDGLKPDMEQAVGERADIRYKTLYNDAMEEIRDAEQEIADGWDEYHSERADAEDELNDAYRELTDGEREYSDGVKDYEQGKIDYADGEREYADGIAKLEDAEKEIADAEQELADAEQELLDAEQELTDARQELNDGWAEYEQAKLDARRELSEAHQKLLDGEEEYKDGEREYADGIAKLADAEKEIADAEKKIRDGEIELSDGEREYLSGERELNDAWLQIQDAQRELSEAEAQLNEAKKQIDEGEASYTQVKQLYDSTAQLAQGIGASMGMSLDAGTLVSYLNSGAMPELNAAVDMALQANGSSAAELTAGWNAAESQLGTSLTTETLTGLRAELDKGTAEYQEGLTKYNSGKAEYQSGLSEYESGAAKLAEAQRELASGKAELDKGRKELADGKKELEEGRQELEDARKKLDEARIELDDGWRDYYSGIEEAEEELDKAYRELTDGEHEYADGLEKYEDGVKKYEDGKKELSDGRQELADAYAELEDARKKLLDAKDELSRAPGELADARRELDDGWVEYQDGRAEADMEFADAEAELTDAEQKLADAYEELQDLKAATTYTLTRNENTGYVCFDNDTSIIEAISLVFPVFFFLVAALVCMTTMTRMVDEQRTQIGVLKALGYSDGQIMAKYLFYSGSAALTGSAAGYALGSYALPWIIWEIYGMIYGFAPLKHVFSPGLMALSFGAALLCSMGATYLSCRIELRRQAAELLRPKTPRAGKRVFLEYITPIWRRLSFLHKVSVRNVLRYRSRLVMMVLGIGGCTALLVTGYGIRDSIQHVADNQYDEIELYDYEVTFQDSQTFETAAAYLESHGWAADDGLLIRSGGADVQTENAKKSVNYVISSTGSLDGFVDLHDKDGAIAYPGEGEAVINIGLAQKMDISIGDEIKLQNDDIGELELTVSGISANYVANYVYFSPTSWPGGTPEYNTLYVQNRGGDAYAEGARLMDDDAVGRVSINQALREQVNNMMSRLDYIVVVVVVCAAALAFIVLYNLTNINITERIREIATIKVLGFYRNETAAYVFREINILSVLGSFAGLLMGKALHAFVMEQIQIDTVYFASRVTASSYLLSFGITLLFTFGISLAMRPKLHKIDMAESLKSIE